MIAIVVASYPVVLAYLFGSHARGTADADSDIDVAVLFEDGIKVEERRSLRFALMRDIAEAMGLSLEKIDVVVLQDVPVLLQYNVVRCGVPVLTRDPETRRDFETNVERRYEDESPLLDREAGLTVARILAYRP